MPILCTSRGLRSSHDRRRAAVCTDAAIPLKSSFKQPLKKPVWAFFASCITRSGQPEGMAEEPHGSSLTFDAADEYRPEPPPEPESPALKDGSIRVGIHTSIAGDITGALDLAHGLGANALQIFSSSPRMRAKRNSRIGEAEASQFRARHWAFVVTSCCFP